MVTSSPAATVDSSRRPTNASIRVSSIGDSVMVVIAVNLRGIRFTRKAPVDDLAMPDRSEPPVHRLLRLVGAVRAGADGVPEVAAEPGVGGLDPVDRLLDPPGHGLAGPFDVVALAAGTTAEPDGGAELGDEELAL